MKLSELEPHDVVVTGRGVVSPIGNSLGEVLRALREGKSGLALDPDFAAWGFRCHVSGKIRGLEPSKWFTEEQMLSMSKTSLYSSIAAKQAVTEAKLTEGDLQREETGVAIGSGMAGGETFFRSINTTVENKSPRRVGAHGVDRAMSSTCAANATVLFRTQGVGEAISSACATGVHNVGYGYRLIKHGYQDTMIVGAGEEDTWQLALGFDGMRVLCADSNADPQRASRPLDKTRSGFIVGAGGAVVVLERWSRAEARGARPLARVAGYWSSSDGSGDMTAPSAEGQRRLLKRVLADARLEPAQIDYVNLHGTSTPTGDVLEMKALAEVLGASGYLVSSSKSQIGHALGAAGALELVFTLLMLEHGFVAPNINVRELDPQLEALRKVVAFEPVSRPLRFAMTNNFGFGNTNGSMIVEAVEQGS